MRLYIDADPFIYKIACAAEPVCYWVGKKDFDLKKDAKAFCKEEGIDESEIEKEHFLFSPRYVRQFIKAQLRVIVPNAREALSAELNREIDVEPVWCLSSKTNARKEIDPEYKANRPPPPRWRDLVKEEIAQVKCAQIREGLEADDLVSFWQDRDPDSCIVSIDKDMDNIPGWHYNPDKDVAYDLAYDESLVNFMKQFLTGDRSDNIPGCGGIGEVKAVKLLMKFTEERGEICVEDLAGAYVEFVSALYKETMKNCPDVPETRYWDNFALLDVGGYWHEQLGLAQRINALDTLRDKDPDGGVHAN